MQNEINRVEPGWDVIGSDDEKIGQIEEVGETYLLLTKGLIFVKDVFVPFDAVTSVDASSRSVFVDVGKDEIDDRNWSSPPADSARVGEDAGGIGAASGFATKTTESDSIRVPVHEEQLRASTERREAGSVDIRRDVVEERQEMEVPVTHEEVTVRRVPATGRAGTETGAFEDQGTIRIPVTAETVRVSKEPQVVEELEITKRPVTETQRVAETVRREQVHVDDEGDVHRTEERDLVGAGSGTADLIAGTDLGGDEGSSGLARNPISDVDAAPDR